MIERNKRKLRKFLLALKKRVQSGESIVWRNGDEGGPYEGHKLVLVTGVDAENFHLGTQRDDFDPLMLVTEKTFTPEIFDSWFPIFCIQFYKLNHIKAWDAL